MFGALLVEMAKHHYDCYQIKYASAEEIKSLLLAVHKDSKKGLSIYTLELEIHVCV